MRFYSEYITQISLLLRILTRSMSFVYYYTGITCLNDPLYLRRFQLHARLALHISIDLQLLGTKVETELDRLASGFPQCVFIDEFSLAAPCELTLVLRLYGDHRTESEDRCRDHVGLSRGPRRARARLRREEVQRTSQHPRRPSRAYQSRIREETREKGVWLQKEEVMQSTVQYRLHVRALFCHLFE